MLPAGYSPAAGWPRAAAAGPPGLGPASICLPGLFTSQKGIVSVAFLLLARPARHELADTALARSALAAARRERGGKLLMRRILLLDGVGVLGNQLSLLFEQAGQGGGFVKTLAQCLI